MRIDRLHRKNQFFVQLYLSCPPPGGQKAAVEAAFCADVAEELQKSRSKIKEKTFSTRIVAAYPASACVPKGFTTACTIIIPMDTVDC